jgi:hypothetical protein
MTDMERDTAGRFVRNAPDPRGHQPHRGPTNYEIIEVDDTPAGVSERRTKMVHSSINPPPVFIRPTPRQDDRDEWGLCPSQQPKGPGYRGPGLAEADDKPTSTHGVNLSAAERERAVLDLAFSNAPIPRENVADLMAHPALGQAMAGAVAIDLANRDVAAQDRIDHMLGVWVRDNPETERTIDLSRPAHEDSHVVDLATWHAQRAIAEQKAYEASVEIDLALALPDEPADLDPATERAATLFLLDDGGPDDFVQWCTHSATAGTNGISWQPLGSSL